MPSSSPSTQTTIPTRILIISDTHSFQFGNPRYPLSLENLPSDIDVLLHCGDLTNIGGLAEYRGALKMLGQIPARLKLVVAGNHDRTLDREWVLRSLGRGKGIEDGDEEERESERQEEEEDLQECKEGNEIMRGELAREAGVQYLEEGVSEWDVGNGARLRIYSSPYTPEFCGWGWAYERDEDRFNGVGERGEGVKEVSGAVRVPSWGDADGERGVDVVMTHGPPMGVLDVVDPGREHVGCESLMRALRRARPRLFCCGHIHEAHGAEVVEWKNEGGGKFAEMGERRKVEDKWPEIERLEIEYGKETLMVNASIMDLSYRPTNKPWFLEIDLPRAEEVEV
ncbi:hypothetical protein CJF31_00009045 [Rutstroemia sp. NJR-2017a BVV2]|nr:hypothetical protein CJF31_00009045 [Rutstroemia sp. NJR-2017a BVV2]